MKTVEIDDNYIKLLEPFNDLQGTVNLAVKKFIIENLTQKIIELSNQNKFFKEKYDSEYVEFCNKVSSDENYLDYIENKRGILNWELDLTDWEFCIKGIEDWKQKLQNILIA
jgi:hypothetical protein